MGNFNDIILHRNEVRDNILKSFDSEFDDELEKGKWNVGDQKFFNGNMHYVAELKPDGSPRWRRVKKNSGASGDAKSSQNNTASSDKKSQSSAKTPNVSQPVQKTPVKQNSIKKNNEIDEVVEDFDSILKMEEEIKKLSKKFESNSISFFKNLGFNHLKNDDYGFQGDYYNYFLKKIKPNDLNDCEVEIKPEFEVYDTRLTSRLIISVKNNSGNVIFNARIEGGYRKNNSNSLKKIMSISQELISGKDFFKTLLSVKNDFDDGNGNIENEFNRLSGFVVKKKSENKNSTIKKNVWNMTDSELIKEFKIPKAVLYHNTIKGYKNWQHDGESSSHSDSFLKDFRRAVEKYGNPVEFKKKSFSNKDQISYNRSRKNGIEYGWLDGEKIEVKFKMKDGRYIYLDNVDIF
jgi:hypothetical protein